MSEEFYAIEEAAKTFRDGSANWRDAVAQLETAVSEFDKFLDSCEDGHCVDCQDIEDHRCPEDESDHDDDPRIR